MYILTHEHVYTYVYIEREREKERQRFLEMLIYLFSKRSLRWFQEPPPDYGAEAWNEALPTSPSKVGVPVKLSCEGNVKVLYIYTPEVYNIHIYIFILVVLYINRFGRR